MEPSAINFKPQTMRFVAKKQPDIRTATTSSCICKSGSNDDSLFLAPWSLDKTGAGGRKYTINREQYTPAKNQYDHGCNPFTTPYL